MGKWQLWIPFLNDFTKEKILNFRAINLHLYVDVMLIIDFPENKTAIMQIRAKFYQVIGDHNLLHKLDLRPFISGFFSFSYLQWFVDQWLVR